MVIGNRLRAEGFTMIRSMIYVRADSDGRRAHSHLRLVLGETVIIITAVIIVQCLYATHGRRACSRTRLARRRFIASRDIFFSAVKRVMKNIRENDENIMPAGNIDFGSRETISYK